MADRLVGSAFLKNEYITVREGKEMNMKRIVIIAAVVIVIGFIGFRVVEAVQKSAADKAVQANTQNYTPVEVLTVAKGSIASAITLSGKVQADREAPALVKAPARVTAVYAKVGDRVNKDQVLFSMEKTTIQSAYDQAAAA